jgi:hypothetical protein
VLRHPQIQSATRTAVLPRPPPKSQSAKTSAHHDYNSTYYNNILSRTELRFVFDRTKAGNSPDERAVSVAIPKQNSSASTLSERLKTRAISSGASHLISWTPANPIGTPKIPPITERSALSNNKRHIKRRREAPMAARIVSSRCLSDVLAMRRVATLTLEITRRQPAAVPSNHRLGR